MKFKGVLLIFPNFQISLRLGTWQKKSFNTWSKTSPEPSLKFDVDFYNSFLNFQSSILENFGKSLENEYLIPLNGLWKIPIPEYHSKLFTVSYVYFFFEKISNNFSLNPQLLVDKFPNPSVSIKYSWLFAQKV